jgi:hypothetical protein
MNLKFAACVAATCAALLPGIAEAKGCLKGAAVGGIGGHFAGHHGLVGAAAGCAVGHHMANKKEAAADAQTPSNATAPAAPAPTKPANKP